MAQQKEASPVAMVVAIVVLLLILFGLWWKFLGPGKGGKGPVVQLEQPAQTWSEEEAPPPQERETPPMETE